MDNDIKKKLLLILIVLFAVLASYLIGCGDETSAEKSDTNLSAQDKVSERFILRNIYGKKYRWSQFVGKPFMINFWATWCGPCRAEIPAMMRLYSEYQPLGLEIVAISLDQERTKGKVVPFIDEYRIPWVVLYGDKNIPEEFHLGSSIPETIFFDAKGNEVKRLIGAQPESVFRRELEKLFPKKPQI